MPALRFTSRVMKRSSFLLGQLSSPINMTEIPKKMRAAVYYGKEDIRIEEADVPTCEDDQVLIKVSSAFDGQAGC